MAQKTTGQQSQGPRAGPGSARRKGASRRLRLLWALGVLLAVAAVVGAAVFLVGGRDGGSGEALAVIQTADFHALTFSPEGPNTIFFGHHNGVMRSDDGGRTWRPLVERRSFDAMGLAVSRANSRQIYLAGHDILQVNTDGGVTWQPVAHNLPGSDIHGFALSSDDPNRLYAFVVGQGLFTSGDSGRTWRKLSDQLPPDVMALAAAGGNPETLYAGSMNEGVLRSVDGGQTWTPSGNALGGRGVFALTVDPAARQTVYAGADGGLFKSTDSGATWSKLPFPGDNAVALAVSPARPNVILAINVKRGQGGFVFRSEDGGLTWGGR